MMMKRATMIAAGAIMAAGMTFAQGGPGMMGGGGMGGGMLVVADDGSLLVTEMGADHMGGPGGGMEASRELFNIGPDGAERWRTSFEEGWPMAPATDGDLVVLTLADDWWTGMMGSGDSGWPHWGPEGPGKVAQEELGPATIVGLDLATGQERWRLEVDGFMAMAPVFAPDGSRIYVTVRSTDTEGIGESPMHQGGTPGAGMLMSTTVVALDRQGQQLWTLDLGDGGMGGPGGGP